MSVEVKIHVIRAGFTLDAELEFPSRGVTGLFGPSGSGKTTILRAIAGLDQQPENYIRVGDSIWQDEKIFLSPHMRAVGYVFQEANLFTHLNVRENIEYGHKRSGISGSLGQTIELLGLGKFLERMPSSLSGGEKQRVAIARALAVGPELLLMDEPLSSLDSASRSEILPYLESLQDDLGVPTIYVSHNLEEIARFADNLILLEEGKALASGPVMEMLTRLDLPLSRGNDAEALIEAVVSGYDDEFHLTNLEFEGGRFTVPRMPLENGTGIRLRVFARDVSLTLEKQEGTSIQNIFKADVDEITGEGEAQMMIRLRIGDAFILSRITKKSAVELDLKKGKAIYAQVKSVVLLS